jgi:hypothetical protein
VYSEHALTSWQVSSLTFSASPCLKYQHFFKQTTIVPVPKNTKVTCLNDFERLVMAHINTIIPETLDPLNLHTAPTDPQMMQSLLHSTLPFTTWTKGTPT